MIVVIPAYQPDEKLLKTVAELRQKTAYTLIVVDDGSSPDRQPIFDKLEHDVTVLHHEVNRGKGAAMKTAFAYIQEHFTEKITLEQTAEQVHLSPVYFSGLFKKETCMNFSEYLTQVRV